MSQFWQNLQVRLQPAVPKDRTGVPDRKWLSGFFSARESIELQTEVAARLASAPPCLAVSPKALIAPHAGYVYSGRVAAIAFATLRGSAPGIERVVLIGPAHYVPVDGIAIPTAT